MLHPELCTISVLYVLARSSYHSFTAHFASQLSGSCCWPQGFHFPAWTNRYRFYCRVLHTSTATPLWKCFVEERIALTAFGLGSLVSVPLFIKLQALVFPLALELCCQNWWNNSTKAGKKRVSGSVENSSYFVRSYNGSFKSAKAGRGPRYPLKIRKSRITTCSSALRVQHFRFVLLYDLSGP